MTVVTKNLKQIPVSVPGQDMAEVVRRVALWHKSNAVVYTEASGSINLFELPGGGLLLRLGVKVSDVFDASGSAAAATGTITVPNDTGTETVWDAGNTRLQSTGYTPSSIEGVKIADSGGMVIFSYVPSSAGVSTNNSGTFEVYIEYIEKENLL